MTLSEVVVAVGTAEVVSLLVVLAAIIRGRRSVRLDLPSRAERARAGEREAA